jgi:hypothetical protein
MNGEVGWSSFFVNLKLDKAAAQLGLQKDREIKAYLIKALAKKT